MASFQTKASHLAIVAEVTEGVPVSPTAGTDYLALQDGYDLAAAFQVLENAELTGSIGKAKPVLGLENPTASIEHYVRHSGVEGQAPNFGKLIEGLLGGKAIASTQYLTAAGSTAGSATAPATINHAAGTGVNFQRGQAQLIKDGTNGYSIRNVLSVSGDTSTLNFNLTSAPAAGVGLGKAALYKPGSTYPTFALWDYRGNGAAVQLVAGSRVIDMSIDASAGQFIKAGFKMAGLSYYYDPIEITASTSKLDFNDGGVKVTTLATGFYKDPHELADAIGTQMDALSSDTITCTYSDTLGKFIISTDGIILSLLWNTGANTANSIAPKIGFSTAANSTGATTYTSPTALSLVSPQTPSFDTASPLVAKDNEVFLGDYFDNVCFCASDIKINVKSDKTDVLCVCSVSGKKESVIIKREVSVDITAILDQYDAGKFHAFHTNKQTSFSYSFGEKLGGNWLPGKTGNIYIPTATISDFKIENKNGLVALAMKLTGYVDSNGNGEVYLNFL